MNNYKKATLFIILSTLSFSIMGATVKYLNNVPSVEKVLFRNLISLFIAGTLAIRLKVPLFGTSTKGRILLVIRSIFGLSGVFMFFYAIGNLPLTESSLIMRLSPFWVIILSAIFLNEKINITKIITITLAILGTFLVVNPEFNGDITPALVGVVASIFAGSAYVTVSKLKKFERPETIIFIFSLFSVVVMLPLALKEWYTPTLKEALLLGLLGISAASGQLFLTYGYRLGKASEISIFNYVGILFSILIGFVFWKEIPDSYTIIGGTLIILAGYISFNSNRD